MFCFPTSSESNILQGIQSSRPEKGILLNLKKQFNSSNLLKNSIQVRFLSNIFKKATSLGDFPLKVILKLFVTELPVNDFETHIVVKFLGSNEDVITTRIVINC
jgi:hypothetical protein